MWMDLICGLSMQADVSLDGLIAHPPGAWKKWKAAHGNIELYRTKDLSQKHPIVIGR